MARERAEAPEWHASTPKLRNPPVPRNPQGPSQEKPQQAKPRDQRGSRNEVNGSKYQRARDANSALRLYRRSARSTTRVATRRTSAGECDTSTMPIPSCAARSSRTAQSSACVSASSMAVASSAMR